MIENKTNLSPINIPPFVLNDLLLKKHNVYKSLAYKHSTFCAK